MLAMRREYNKAKLTLWWSAMKIVQLQLNTVLVVQTASQCNNHYLSKLVSIMENAENYCWIA